MNKIEIKTTEPIEAVAQALAEGGHTLGDDATRAAGALLQWAGQGCPWFVPHPEHLGGVVAITPFDGFDVEQFEVSPSALAVGTALTAARSPTHSRFMAKKTAPTTTDPRDPEPDPLTSEEMETRDEQWFADLLKQYSLQANFHAADGLRHLLRFGATGDASDLRRAVRAISREIARLE